MRIISGTYGGRTLVAPAGLKTRPTSGRVRESLFSHLHAAILPAGFEDLVVLDLFAGSGALGLEAVSRGAARAVFVDREQAALRAIETNIRNLQCEPQTRLIPAALPAALERLKNVGPFDLVFVDPPYAATDTGRLLDELVLRRLVTATAHAVWELDARAAPALPQHWEIRSDRRHGDTRLLVMQRAAAPETDPDREHEADC